MKSKFLSIFAIAPLLFACGDKNAVPKKGYDLFKKRIEALLPVGGSITWNNCSFAYIEKSIAGYAELDRTCWYCIHSILYISAQPSPCTDYVLYDDKSGIVGNVEAVDYSNARAVATSGKVTGWTGTL